MSSLSMNSVAQWLQTHYTSPFDSVQQSLRIAYVVFSFCCALFIGFFKAVTVGPVAGILLIVGNIGVMVGLFPFHVFWTVYSLLKTKQINVALKLAVLFALPVLFVLWLALGIFGSIIVGIGYGFFTPWISTFEAFRQNSEAKKFFHSIVDGTWGTIKGSCIVVRDFGDICYHSYPVYLKELRELSGDHESHSIRFGQVPACIAVGLIGLAVDVPLFTVIAIIKSPYMLFKGWQRLLHDLISREGIFLETACVPIAGLAILFWPLVVVGSILLVIISSIFVGLYGSVIVYQERSFQRGIAYVVAIISEFDEYTNDWLYLREGSILPKPKYRKRKVSNSDEFSVGSSIIKGGKTSPSSLAPALLVPKLGPSRSVREAIQEVKMVKIWEELMNSCESKGKELVDANVISSLNLREWLRTKGNGQETVGLGLPSYALLHILLYAIKAGSGGLLLCSGIEVNHLNRPQDRLLDWFFHPIMVLKEQMKVIQMREEEVRFLEKLVVFNTDMQGMELWDNGSVAPEEALRAAQIQAISRRLVGITRSITKFPTYRRRYRQVVKLLIAYCHERDGAAGTGSTRSVSSIEIVQTQV
ncbi:uncharacterized protein A4U43_C08F22700 [Asparagus officinalis]|uniref:uncharacterized membrane protein At3g27390-like n=1 Tax=Asparagus officinalis TaxID=4686 RepID=UPI00098DF12F|nr:uncharacterized membrane protein At3g27390-like [Asparagus officinalis]ONK60796.1 uncharacterized protein A4U43_C08F22700 [Asparagus officinalis]